MPSVKRAYPQSATATSPQIRKSTLFRVSARNKSAYGDDSLLMFDGFLVAQGETGGAQSGECQQHIPRLRAANVFFDLPVHIRF
jgi:hypothetical protein